MLSLALLRRSLAGEMGSDLCADHVQRVNALHSSAIYHNRGSLHISSHKAGEVGRERPPRSATDQADAPTK